MFSRRFVLFLMFLMICQAAVLAQVVGKVEVVSADSSDSKDKEKGDKKKKDKGKPFEEVVDEYQKIEGLFTFWQSKEENKVYLEIKPAQLDVLFLCNITREGGDGTFFDGGAMLDEYPFFFRRLGDQIQMVEKNFRFRADSQSAIARAIERDIPNSIKESAKIASAPHPQSGSILVDAAELFLVDIADVGSMTSRAKMSYSMDKGTSFFSEVKSFPKNSELEITLNFKSSKSQRISSLADSKSLIHRYHYSLAAMPESSYQPRQGDDRVGHFHHLHQDYSSLLKADPYVRYVNRWHLEKSEPQLKLSKPRQPIVYWLENTIPVQFREAVRKGVLVWNSAFERIGFQDAIEVRQMPDDADWDPADIRYNTIRWIVQPGDAYAVGPSRANPLTGEIYDADIRISADFVRFYDIEFSNFTRPGAWQHRQSRQLFPGLVPPDSVDPDLLAHQCQFSQGMMHQMSFGWHLIEAGLTAQAGKTDLQNYLEDAIVSLVVHEVGHTLGLRHNFKSSAVFSQAELDKAAFADQNGLAGSVMDYTAVNVGEPGGAQGRYFQTTLGAYDYWAIEYAYKPYDPSGKESESAMLARISQRASGEKLLYATDEDAFGLSLRSVDPLTNLWDLGSDPLAFYQRRIRLSKALWAKMLDTFDEDGERYPRLRRVFSQGISEYALAALTVTKFVGGLYHHRDHIGDPGNRPPFEVVPAGKQREALNFLCETYFRPNSFEFDPRLLNRLAPERNWDFDGTLFYMYRLDYPIHGIVQLLQANALFSLLDPLLLARVQDNEVRFEKGAEKFTMPEIFEALRGNIWQELSGTGNINSYRREVQRMHLYMLNIIINEASIFFPHDAVTLAFADLNQLKEQIRARLERGETDTYTRAHLSESASRIESILNARLEKAF
ncbi:MAG: zinc-dependent metalloprotease [Calditrichaeota bacterium]|nr:zinc-dependent metalloprotease [Calditrichota bacterium]